MLHEHRAESKGQDRIWSVGLVWLGLPLALPETALLAASIVCNTLYPPVWQASPGIDALAVQLQCVVALLEFRCICTLLRLVE